MWKFNNFIKKYYCRFMNSNRSLINSIVYKHIIEFLHKENKFKKKIKHCEINSRSHNILVVLKG